MQPISVSSTRHQDQITVVFGGVLNALSAPSVRTLVNEIVAQPKTSVTIDLSHLELIDSSGIGVIVSLYKQLCDQHRRLVLCGLQKQPLAVFKLLHFDRCMELRTQPAPKFFA